MVSHRSVGTEAKMGAEVNMNCVHPTEISPETMLARCLLIQNISTMNCEVGYRWNASSLSIKDNHSY